MDAKGLLDIAEVHRLISKYTTNFQDSDGGTGAGWNATYSPPINFTKEMKALVSERDALPTGYSSDLSWMGGIRCREGSQQFGGFGGGGAGCQGGGGGGGFVGELTM